MNWTDSPGSGPAGLWALGLLLMLAGCPNATNTSVSFSGFIEGTVRSDGDPLPDALVFVDADHWARTDEEGAYRIEDLDGPVDISIFAAGHRPRTILAWDDTLVGFGLSKLAVEVPRGRVEGVGRLPQPFEETVSVHVHVGGTRSTLTFDPGETEASFAHDARAGGTAATAYSRGDLWMDYYGVERGQFVPEDGVLEVEVDLVASTRGDIAGSLPQPPDWADDFVVSARLSLDGEGSAFVSDSGEAADDGSFVLPVVLLPPADSYTVSALAVGDNGTSLTLYHPPVIELSTPVAFPEHRLRDPSPVVDFPSLDFSWTTPAGVAYQRLRLQQYSEEFGWETRWTAEGVADAATYPQLPAELAEYDPVDPEAPTRVRVEAYLAPEFDPVLNWNFDSLEARVQTGYIEWPPAED